MPLNKETKPNHKRWYVIKQRNQTKPKNSNPARGKKSKEASTIFSFGHKEMHHSFKL